VSFADFWPPPERLPDPGPYQPRRQPLIVNPREAEALREALGELAPDMIISEPIPSAPTMIKRLNEVAAAMPRPPRRTLHCHPSVTVALMLDAPPKPEPSFTDLGQIGDLRGIDVYEDPEMMPGAWEIREGAQGGKGGKLVTFGVLRSVS
jgi:hypothetical protein